MEQSGDQGVICRQLKCQCPSDSQGRGHAVAGSTVQTAGGRTQVRMDIVGCPDMRWGHGEAKKTGT